jgi:hypothetical protein
VITLGKEDKGDGCKGEAKKEQEEQTQINADEETSLRVKEEDQMMTKLANSNKQCLFEEVTKATKNILTIGNFSMKVGDINVTTLPPPPEQEKANMMAVKEETNTTAISEGDPPPSPEQEAVVVTAVEGLMTLNKASSYKMNQSQCHSRDGIEKEMRARDYDTVCHKGSQTIDTDLNLPNEWRFRIP